MQTSNNFSFRDFYIPDGTIVMDADKNVIHLGTTVFIYVQPPSLSQSQKGESSLVDRSVSSLQFPSIYFQKKNLEEFKQCLDAAPANSKLWVEVKHYKNKEWAEDDIEKLPFLHLAILFASKKHLQWLVAEKKLNIHEPDQLGFLPIFGGLDRENVKILECLLTLGANIHCFVDNLSLLMVATAFQTSEFVQFLIRKGANVNLANERGETALHFAAFTYGPLDIIQVLVWNKAEINKQDIAGDTPLHWAIHKFNLRKTKDTLPDVLQFKQDELAKVKAFVECGANVALRNKAGLTPLELAIQLGAQEIVSYLQEYNANIELNIM